MKRFFIVASMAMLCLFNADAQKKIPGNDAKSGAF